jgi:broad specificity phosphatase PhoE
MEIHQGDWQTRLRSEIEEMYPDLFAAWEITPWEVTPPGGEHLNEVQQRVGTALDEMIRMNKGKTIGIVTHRIPIALIKVRYQGMDPDIVRTIELPNAYWEEIEIS